jgi:alpha-1,6-mannosyltransferase
MRYIKLLSSFYITTIVALFLYSFTQIDLSLTFSRIDFLHEIVKSFQYVGYFNRPLSTFIYVFLIVLLFNFYLGFLVLAYTKLLSKKMLWKLIIITTVILTFSYNAFSYDIFNYIFDAKIITHYQQNPYLHKALDFAGDPMLSFMRWTHRVYPYGPVWLGLTVPLSFLGFQFFLPTFFLFKSLIAASFLGTLYFIGKIFQKVAPEKEIFGLVFFGLQPLIIIESLVSGHLDIVMFFFAAWAVYLLLQKKYLFSFLLLFVSIGIKFVTGFLLPLFIVVFLLKKLKNKF